MQDKITITGKITSYQQSWCIEVTPEEYRRIVGEEMYQLDKGYREEWAKSPDKFISIMADEPYVIYPNDLMTNLNLEYGQQVVLDITVQERL